MTLPVPEPGLVISYAYLWRAEYDQGREKGAKNRPCAIVLAVVDDGGDTVVTVVPVTHAPPQRADESLEIPALVNRRLGLDRERSWIVISELNRFVWPGPDLRPVSSSEPDRFAYGMLPPSLFQQVRQVLLAALRARRVKPVDRTE